MKMITLLLSCICFPCMCSDKSDQLPDVNRDNNTNTVTITNNLQLTPKRHSHRPAHAGPKHPAVEAAHELARRQQEDDNFVTCCCFFKIRKR